MSEAYFLAVVIGIVGSVDVVVIVGMVVLVGSIVVVPFVCNVSRFVFQHVEGHWVG